MKIERVLAIVMLLLGREKVSCRELADRFEVSLRTVHRDIETINAAGIPVWGQPGVGGGVGILPEYKVEKRIFTSEDILALLTALGFVQGAVPQGEIAAALAKIEGLLPQGALPEGGQLVFDPSAWMGVDVGGLVGRLHAAIRERRCVRFAYLGQTHQKSHRTAEPTRLLYKQNAWYLQAWCQTRGAARLFKLARMWDVQILEQTYTPRALPPIPDVYTRCMQHSSVRVRLRVAPTALDRMLEYVRAEQLQTVGDCYEVDFDLVPDAYGFGLLLGFGTEVECIAPQWVREELAARACSTAEMYSGTPDA